MVHMHWSYLLQTAFIGLGILLLAEYGYRRRWWRGEGARKLVHIMVGVFAATWPWYLDWLEIRLISITLVVGFVVCMRLKLFQSLGSIERLSYGEVLFALMIGGVTLITQAKGIYAAAVLHLAVADGLAALIGTRFGKSTRYAVFGHRKSVVGTGAFFVTSLVILTGWNIGAHANAPVLLLAGLALGAAILENVGVYGSDNVLVPTYVAVFLCTM